MAKDINANLEAKRALSGKEALTFKEVLLYTGFSKGYLYRLTAEKRIPYYKPNGKNLFFDRNELNQWLLSNRYYTDEELDEIAARRCRKEA